MIMKANKQIGFIYKNNESIDKILKDGDVVFERGFLREKTSTTLPITFGGVGKDLKDYKIYGKTYQNSTSGKNLFDISNVTSVDNGSISDSLITSDTITASGVQNIRPRFSTPFPFKAGTYYISADIRRKSGTGELNKFNDGFTDYTKVIFPKLTNEFQKYVVSHQYNSPTSYADSRLLFQVANNSNQLVLEIKNIMISTSNDYDFEPYTGGQPSPNPDYPQEIISCGDRTKNLIPTNSNDYEIGTINSSTGINQDNTTRIRTKDYYPITVGDYHISIENDNYSYVNILYYDKNKNFLYAQGAIQNKTNINISITNENVAYFRSVFRLSSNDDIVPSEILNIKPMITLGDTKLDFEPYGYKIPVNVRSDNFYNKNDELTNKYINDTGSEIPGASGDLFIKTIIDNNIAQKYTVNFSNRVGTGYIRISFFNGNTFISRILITESNQIINVPTNATKIDIRTDETTTKYFENLQIVEGTTAPSKYIPYYNETTNIPLSEVPTTRKIKKVVFTGSADETWNRAGSTHGYFNDLPNEARTAGATKILSSHYVPAMGGADGTVRIGNSKTEVLIYDNYTSVTDFKAYLAQQYAAGTPVTVWYVLAESETGVISEPLCKIGDYADTVSMEQAGVQIPTIDGNNTLNIETEITPSQVYIKYKSNE